MVTEFGLKISSGNAMGYHWECHDATCVMCLVHGIGEYAGRYERMAGSLLKAGIAVIGIDLRGHGCTQGKRGHTAPREEILDDIDRLIEYAKAEYADKPIILYGHSMGGNIVLDYRIRGTLSDKPAVYIVSAPWLTLVRKISKPAYRVLKSIARIKPDFQISAMIKPEQLGNPDIIFSERKISLCHNLITLQTAVDGFEIGKKILEQKLKGNGGGVDKPILLMHGSADKICDANSTRHLASLLGENCTYIEWKGFFHEIHNGNLEKDGSEVILTIIDWIKNRQMLFRQ